MVLIATDQDLSQSSGIINFPRLNEIYEAFIDMSLVGMGQTITLHLPPSIKENINTQVSPFQGQQYSPFFGGAARYPDITKRSAVEVTPRDLPYTAHVKIGPMELDDKMGIGRLEANEAMTTTSRESEVYLRQCYAATINGRKYTLKEGLRPVGLIDKKYIMAVWVEMNEGAPIAP